VGRILEGGPATIAVTVTVGAPALGLPETSIGLGPGSLLGAGLLRMDTQFPPGVRMAADHTRDGWECGASTCHRVGLTLTRSSTAAVPLEIDRGARGDLVFTVSAPGIVSATATLPDAIDAATPGSWTGKLHGTVRTIGGTGRSDSAASGTPSSSTASEPGHGTAVLPADGPVRWAGLYWSTPDPDAQTAPALLGAPGGDGAILVRPTDVRAVPRHTGAYRAFADVTDVVRAAGPGPWWVAGIGAGVARAWQLVVVTEERAGPLRQIVVDGARRGGDGPPARTGGTGDTGGATAGGTGTVPGSWSALLTELTAAARPPLREDTGAGLLGALTTATDLE
jgi:hypothetical protein